MDVTIRNVSDTAWWTAAGRFMESNRNDALFKDPLAGVLLEGSEIGIPAEDNAAEHLGWLMAVRTKLIDDMVMELVNSKKIDAVINLACGLCTRVYRLPLPKEFFWVDVDFAPVIDFKRDKLNPVANPCQLEFRAVDLRQPEARDQLLRDVTQRFKNVAVITEGLLIYLDEVHVLGLSEQFLQHGIKYWISDFYTHIDKLMNVRPEMEEVMRRADAQLRFNPPEGVDFFSKHGWKMLKKKNFLQEGTNLGRKPTDQDVMSQEFGAASNAVLLEPSRL